MKRYLLFLGDIYYPSGGWEDFRGSFPSIEQAKREIHDRTCASSGGWWHIVDGDTFEMVASGLFEACDEDSSDP